MLTETYFDRRNVARGELKFWLDDVHSSPQARGGARDHFISMDSLSQVSRDKYAMSATTSEPPTPRSMGFDMVTTSEPGTPQSLRFDMVTKQT